MNYLQKQMDDMFLNYYKQFRDFKEGTGEKYWLLCMKSLENNEFINYMKLCNDINGIPPVKSFLLYYSDEIKAINNYKTTKINFNIRRSIGAFFGMLFQYILGYDKSKTKSVRVSMYEFDLSTASIFSK